MSSVIRNQDVWTPSKNPSSVWLFYITMAYTCVVPALNSFKLQEMTSWALWGFQVRVAAKVMVNIVSKISLCRFEVSKLKTVYADYSHRGNDRWNISKKLLSVHLETLISISSYAHPSISPGQHPRVRFLDLSPQPLPPALPEGTPSRSQVNREIYPFQQVLGAPPLTPFSQWDT